MTNKDLLIKAINSGTNIEQTETATVTNIFNNSELDTLNPNGINLNDTQFWTNYKINHVKQLQYKVTIHIKLINNNQLPKLAKYHYIKNKDKIQIMNLSENDVWKVLKLIIN